MLHDLSRINDELAARIDELVPRLYVNAVQVGNYWEMGDLGGEPGTSLKVWRKGSKQGEWCDFAGASGGRPLGLVIASKYGGAGDAGEGIRWAVRWLGHADETPADKARREADAKKLRDAKAKRVAADRDRKRRAALHLFLAGVPIAGTPAERYFLGRAIDLRRLGRQPGALRFHPEVRCPEDESRVRTRPCLLGAISGEHGFMTVHRHFLHALPDGRVVKADSDDVPAAQRMHKAKQVYSDHHGGTIALWRGDSGKPLKAMPAGEWIVGAEGIEDGLTIALAEPDMRVVAAVTLGNLGRMFLPAQCGGLYWHRHRGDGPQAVEDWRKQQAMLAARGLETRELWAPGGHKDFNEWAQAERDRAAAERRAG